eukprot:885896_1
MAFNSQSSISDKRRSNSESSSPSLASKLSFTSSSLSSSYVHLATRRRNLGPAIMTRNNSVFAIVFISLACVLYFNYYIMNNHHTVTTVEYQEPLNYSHLQNTGLSEFAPREIYIQHLRSSLTLSMLLEHLEQKRYTQSIHAQMTSLSAQNAQTIMECDER